MQSNCTKCQKKASQQQHVIVQGGPKVLPQVREKFGTQYVTI